MTSSASVTTLPPLDADELAHSHRLVEHIRAFMAAQELWRIEKGYDPRASLTGQCREGELVLTA